MDEMFSASMLLLVLALLHCSARYGLSQVACPKVAGQPGCVCDHSDGRIDLTPLSDTGKPRFTGIHQLNGEYTFDYNPCHTFVNGTDCPNVYVCQTLVSDNNFMHNVADEAEEIRIDDTRIFVYYEENHEENTRYTRVYLYCDQSAKTPMLTTTGDTIEQLNYVFDLTSCHACPGGCSAGGGGTIAGPVGLALIFLFIFAIVAYFVIGAIVMRQKYGATGTDMIPQKDIWFDVPFLIKDGFAFIFSPCINRGYSKI